MLAVALLLPPLHGTLGVADELLLFCLPVVVAIAVLAITSRRARQQDRVRHKQASREDTKKSERGG